MIKPLILLAALFLMGYVRAQSCQVNYYAHTGSTSLEKVFVHSQNNPTSITLLTPGATPATSTFPPGTTVSVLYAAPGTYSVTHILSNSTNGCSDTTTSTIQVCLIDLSTVTLSATNPGEFTVTDPALDNPGETGSIDFLNGSMPLNASVTGNTNLTDAANSTQLVTNANGTHSFWYITNNASVGCYDSLLISVDVDNVLNCQAGLGTQHMAWISPGTFKVYDQSVSMGSGTFNCAGAVPSTIVFDPSNGYWLDTVEFAGNGVYPYTYVTFDSISNCLDSVSGVFNVTGYPPPCTVQAGINVNYACSTSPNYYCLEDNSTSATGNWTGLIQFTPDPGITGYQSVMTGSSNAVVFNSNGVYYFTYTVTDGSCSSTISDSIVVYSLPSGSPCQADLEITMGPGPGQATLTDTSSNYTVGTFYSANASPQTSTILPGGSTIIDLLSNSWSTYTYSTENSSTGCTDSLMGVFVASGVPCPPFNPIQWSTTTNPGEVVFEDPTLSGNVTATLNFLNASNSLAYPTYSITPGNATTVQLNGNGTYVYSYKISNTQINCSDSIIDTLFVDTYISCQAGLNSWGSYITPGALNVSDQSLNAQVGTLYCAGATPQMIGVNINLLGYQFGGQLTFPAGGSYPYTYITQDTIGGCTDTLTGVFVITSLPMPCTVQADLLVTPTGNTGEYTITDNSLNAMSGTYFSTNSGGIVNLSQGGSTTVVYTSTGWHNYTYVVSDSSGTCEDTVTGSIYVSGINCGAFAGLTVTPTGNPGEYTLTDNSTSGTSSYFYDGNGSGTQVLPSTSVTYTYPSNGTYTYTYFVDDSLTLCTDSVIGTIVVTSVLPPSNCSATFTLVQDSLNTSQYYCWNNAINSTGGTSGLTYLWDFGDGLTSTQAYPVHTYSTLGTFTICLTISESLNGCTSTFCDTIVVTNKATGTTINVLPPGATIGLEEVTVVENISLFPNPSDGIFTLQLDAQISMSVELEIISSTGQTVYTSREEIEEGANEIVMDQSGLSNGLYLIKLKSFESGLLETIRFLKK